MCKEVHICCSASYASHLDVSLVQRPCILHLSHTLHILEYWTLQAKLPILISGAIGD